MSAKIIELKDYRTTVRSPKNKIPFPQLYRLTGVYFDAGAMDNGRLEPGTEPAGPFYALQEQEGPKIANPKYEAIQRLDPAIDSGWVIIRHHMRDDYVEGYLDAHSDFRPPERDTYQMVYRTKEGLFTVMHRPPNEGRPDHLIVYITKVEHPGLPELGVPAGWMDSVQIFHSDGTITDNQDLLYEDEEEDE